MRKRVRLTESELRDMIVESVKSTINEMNWKTTANSYRSSVDELNKYKNGKYEENESFKRMIDHAVNEAVDEGIGNWIKGAALGGMMAMSNAQAVQAQDYQQKDSTQVTTQQSQQMTIKQLKKLFPQAYKDRNANSQVWKENKNIYVAEINGKISLVGMIAASYGQNPWDALVKKYCPQEDKTFKLDDFDI